MLSDHTGRCSERSRLSDQSRLTHDGRTYRVVFLARRVGGGWPNEGAVVRRLERPAYTAQTGSPGLGCEDTYAPSYRAWTWPDLPHRASTFIWQASMPAVVAAGNTTTQNLLLLPSSDQYSFYLSAEGWLGWVGLSGLDECWNSIPTTDHQTQYHTNWDRRSLTWLK